MPRGGQRGTLSLIGSIRRTKLNCELDQSLGVLTGA
jgi:hypothetical protein